MVDDFKLFSLKLLPVQSGNTVLNYTYSTKSLGVVIDCRLFWRDQVHEMWKSYCEQINILKLLEDIYFKTIIPHVTFSISVWGSCSPAIFAEIDQLHLHVRAAKIIDSLPKNIMECDILQRVHWQSLGYIYKCRLAIEMFKANTC